VRTLAAKTQCSTIEIQTKIADLVSSTNKSVEVMEHAVTEANKGGELVKNTANSLDLVAKLVANVSCKNSESNEVAKAQSISVKDVQRNICDIAAQSESTACATLQTTQASQELARLTASMSGIVQQFKY
jgi:methyl-accepting chemotaxis protein